MTPSEQLRDITNKIRNLRKEVDRLTNEKKKKVTNSRDWREVRDQIAINTNEIKRLEDEEKSLRNQLQTNLFK